jgi:hypothetical protein
LAAAILAISGSIYVAAQVPADPQSSAVDTSPAVAANVTTTKTTKPDPKTRSTAKQAVSDDKWQFQLTPYGWLSGVSGTIAINGNPVTVDAGIGDTLSNLHMFLMGTFEAHKNKVSILTDLQYSDLRIEKATPGPGFSTAEARTKTFVFDPEFGYRFSENKDKGSFAEVVGGMRYWHVSEELKLGAGALAARDLTASRSWADAVVGLRGKAAISKKMFVTGKFDLGGGGSKFTWQGFGGIGYNMGEHFALVGGYRNLSVNRSKTDFIFDVDLRGPLVGLAIKF